MGGTFCWENAELSTVGIVTWLGLFSVARLSVRYGPYRRGGCGENLMKCLHLPDGSWHAPRATQKKTFSRVREDNRYPGQPDGGSQRPSSHVLKSPPPSLSLVQREAKNKHFFFSEMSPLKTWHLLLGQAGVSSRVSCINEVSHFV